MSPEIKGKGLYVTPYGKVRTSLPAAAGKEDVRNMTHVQECWAIAPGNTCQIIRLTQAIKNSIPVRVSGRKQEA